MVNLLMISPGLVWCCNLLQWKSHCKLCIPINLRSTRTTAITGVRANHNPVQGLTNLCTLLQPMWWLWLCLLDSHQGHHETPMQWMLMWLGDEAQSHSVLPMWEDRSHQTQLSSGIRCLHSRYRSIGKRWRSHTRRDHCRVGFYVLQQVNSTTLIAIQELFHTPVHKWEPWIYSSYFPEPRNDSSAIHPIHDSPPLCPKCIPKWEQQIPKHYVLAATPSERSLNLDIAIQTTDTGEVHAVSALLNSGATGLFIDPEFGVMKSPDHAIISMGYVRKTLKLNSLFFFIYFRPREPKHNSKCSQTDVGIIFLTHVIIVCGICLYVRVPVAWSNTLKYM